MLRFANAVARASLVLVRGGAREKVATAPTLAVAQIRRLGQSVGLRAAEPGARSFIEIATEDGADSLVGNTLPHKGGFDAPFGTMRVVRMDDGLAETEFVVDKGMGNAYGTLHGGAVASLVDIVGTLALLSRDSRRAGVSVDLNVTYLAGAQVGDKVRCIGKVLRQGRRLGMTEVLLEFADSGKLVARGSHTKVM